jgi:hypothetical protein
MSDMWNFWASLIGPSLAVLLSVWFTVWYDRWKQDKEERIRILKNLMAYRATPPIPEFIQALNTIPLVFYRQDKIRQSYEKLHEFVSNLKDEELARPNNLRQYDELLTVLIREIARELKYGKNFEDTDIKKVFYPNLPKNFPMVPPESMSHPPETIPVKAKRP